MHALSRVYSAFKSPPHRWLTWRQSCSQLFVGGLSYDTNESVLKGAFEEYGEVIEVKVICDRVRGKSRGYGFVHYSSETAAGKALKEMDGRLLDGRNIRIHYAYRRGRQGSQAREDHCPQGSNISFMKAISSQILRQEGGEVKMKQS